MVMSEYKRNQQLLEQFKNQKNREKGEELLKLLPQGEGSGLNADLVDDMHAEDIIKEAQLRQKKFVGGGGGGMQVHGNEFHEPDFLSSITEHGADKHDHTTWYACITPLGAILPDTNPPAQTKVTGTNFTYYVLDFDKTTPESIFAQFKLPPNYSPGASLKVIIQWISTVTSGAVVWAAQILGRADGETFDSAPSSAQVVITTTDGTAGKINTSEITLNSPDLAENDVFILKLFRFANYGADTMDADARVIMVGIAL